MVQTSTCCVHAQKAEIDVYAKNTSCLACALEFEGDSLERCHMELFWRCLHVSVARQQCSLPDPVLDLGAPRPSFSFLAASIKTPA